VNILSTSLRDHRLVRPRSWCATLLSFSLLSGSLTGCDDGEGPAAAEQQEGRFASMSGEDIYLGLFLGQGEAASLLPEVYDNVSVGEKVRDPEDVLVALRSAKAEREAKGDEAGAKLLQSTIEAVERGIVEGQLLDGLVISDTVAATFVLQVAARDPGFFDRFAGEIRSGDPRRVERALDDATQISRQVAEELAFKPDAMQPRGGLAVVTVAVVAAALYAFVVIAEGFWVVLYEEARSKSGGLLRDELVARVTEAFAPR